MPDHANWEQLKPLLIDRIRRRALALQRLSGERIDREAVTRQIESCGDDAKALWALAEQIDRALDIAMTPRLTRLPLPTASPLPRDDFKSP